MRRAMTPALLERVAGATTVASMLATPFTPPRSRRRLALTWATVVGGATRTWAVERRRRGTTSSSVAATIVVAGTLAAEVLGTRSGRVFGRYAYTGRLAPAVRGVPLLVPVAWYAMAVPARAVAGRALGSRATPVGRVALGAAALTAWDLFLDPQMTADGAWRWAGPGRYRGIPATNFLGWFVVSAGVMCALEATSASDDVAHVATYGTLGAMETVAFSTFWRDPVVAVAGGLAMLPITAMALLGDRGLVAAPGA